MSRYISEEKYFRTWNPFALKITSELL